MAIASFKPGHLDIRYLSDGEIATDRTSLGLVSFGDTCLPEIPALRLQVALDPLDVTDAHRFELLGANGAIRQGQDSAIRFASDDQLLLASIEVDEAAQGGIEAAAEYAYRAIQDFNARSTFPCLLRMWNYLDAINEGDGDDERYRRFCVGRARGFGQIAAENYPAASALGHQRRTGQLQVYWLAGRNPGLQLENPRQLSAYRYPRIHGSVSPSFARACLLPGGPLLISGTASIVGHASLHAGNVQAQLQETLNNLDALIISATQHAPHLPRHLGRSSRLKIYVRNPGHAAEIAACLRTRYGAQLQFLMLAADICRRELLLEIDCAHGLNAGN